VASRFQCSTHQAASPVDRWSSAAHRCLPVHVAEPKQGAGTLSGHSAMSARCPVCRKADTTGRFMRSCPKARTIACLLAAATSLVDHADNALAQAQPCGSKEYAHNAYHRLRGRFGQAHGQALLEALGRNSLCVSNCRRTVAPEIDQGQKWLPPIRPHIGGHVYRATAS
jgi:hypothetical protein